MQHCEPRNLQPVEAPINASCSLSAANFKWLMEGMPAIAPMLPEAMYSEYAWRPNTASEREPATVKSRSGLYKWSKFTAYFLFCFL